MKILNKIISLFYFILFFTSAFIKANLSLAFFVLFMKRSNLSARVLSCDISDLSLFETTLLSLFITLTPGTIAASIENSHKILRIHALTSHKKKNAAILKEVGQIKTALLRITR